MEKNKLFMIVIIAILFIILAGVSFGFVLTIRSLNSVSQNEESNGFSAVGAGSLSISEITFIDVEGSIKANLMPGADAREHLALIEISVGIGGATKDNQKEFDEFKAMIEEEQIVIRDAVIRVLRNKTYEDLKNPNAYETVGEEILLRLQDTYKSNFIVDVYFGEFFVD